MMNLLDVPMSDDNVPDASLDVSKKRSSSDGLAKSDPKKHRANEDDEDLRLIHAWKAKSAPRDNTTRALADQLVANHTCNPDLHINYYAPYVVMLQCTGSAKSRTMFELPSRGIPVLYFCLRGNPDGWPPSDQSLVDFLQKPLDKERSRPYFEWAHNTDIGLIEGASREQLQQLQDVKTIERTNEGATYTDITEKIHQYLKKRSQRWEKDENIDGDSIAGIASCTTCWQHLQALCIIHSILQYVLQQRSKMEPWDILHTMNNEVGEKRNNPKRTKTLDDIIIMAQGKMASCWNAEWFTLFKPDYCGNKQSAAWFWRNGNLKVHSLIQETVNAAEQISESLKGSIPLVVALDDIAGLGTPSDEPTKRKEYARVHTLTRVLTIFRPSTESGSGKPAVWFLLASTLGMTEVVAPPSSLSDHPGDGSYRHRPRPDDPRYWTWPFFHELYIDLWVSLASVEDFQCPDRWDEIGYITCFGRPLWRICDTNLDALKNLVWAKLAAGQVESANLHHILTRMEKKDEEVFRQFSLATLSHLMILDPVLTEVTNFEFMKTAVNGYMRYCQSMNIDERTIVTSTLSDPAIPWVLMQTFRTCRSLFEKMVNAVFGSLVSPGRLDFGDFGELYARLTLIHTRLFLPKNSQQEKFRMYISVEDLLKEWLGIELLIEDHFEMDETAQISLGKLGKGWVNFTHFWSMKTIIEPTSPEFKTMLKNAFRRTAAILPPHNQPFIDLIVPVYLGRLDQKFDPDQLTLLVVQIKNRDKKPLSPFVEFGGPKGATRDYGLFDGPVKGTQLEEDTRRAEAKSKWFTRGFDQVGHSVLYVCLNLASDSDNDNDDRNIHLFQHVPHLESKASCADRLWAVWVMGRRGNIKSKLGCAQGPIDALFRRPPSKSYAPDTVLED